jgi:alpha-beta hydrolase superfamily lysophospholipase
MKRLLATGFFALCLVTPLLVLGQHLVRRPLLGCRVAPINDSIQTAHKLKATEGLLVQRVHPEGSFVKLGGQLDDLILTFNGKALRQPADFSDANANLQTGADLQFEISRKGKRMQLKGKLLPMPWEQGGNFSKVEYGEAAFQTGYLRTIFRHPLGPGPHPTVYFIPGYTCASVDNLAPYHPYSIIIDSLVRMGYAVYRIEKPGVGDGPHPCNCATTGFDLELEVFKAGYADLLGKPGVDPGRVFIFGHSMGGIQAPLLAAQLDKQPLGIALYGTAFQSWYEYIIAMCRFQFPRNGQDYRAFESDMREYVSLFHDHYVLMKPISEIIRNKRWEALLQRDFELTPEGDILGRRAEYWQELAKQNAVEAWSQVQSHVLAMYGTADFEVFNPFSMEEITKIVNAYHPGHGKFVALEGVDHAMIQVGNMDEGVALRTSPAYRSYFMERFDKRLVSEFITWMGTCGGS